ncbi:uncharacterized protein LOC144449458 [Glandiceps talaboti]
MSQNVFLYIPNIIGYLRLLLLFTGYLFFDARPVLFVVIYSISVILDGIDGFVARKLNQVSAFGAWLDVVVDNLGRGMLWCRLYHWGWLVTSIEWCVFVCTHSQLGADWKAAFQNAPWHVQKVMANGFKTPLGTLVICGIHVLPIWLYGHYTHVLTDNLGIPMWLQYLGISTMSIGRALCLAVELWCIWTHIRSLDREKNDENNKD